MKRALALVFILVLTTGVPSLAQGLLWNRTGLPAVFPLQIRTDPGSDWTVTLHDAVTGAPALSAAFTGGEFFRVLVPPGTFRVVMNAGGEVFTLERTLTFEVQGIGRKVGHLVDLRGRSLHEPEYAGLSICQHLRVLPAVHDAPTGTIQAKAEQWIDERYC